jgi:hypothetical protein
MSELFGLMRLQQHKIGELHEDFSQDGSGSVGVGAVSIAGSGIGGFRNHPDT